MISAGLDTLRGRLSNGLYLIVSPIPYRVVSLTLRYCDCSIPDYPDER